MRLGTRLDRGDRPGHLVRGAPRRPGHDGPAGRLRRSPEGPAGLGPAQERVDGRVLLRVRSAAVEREARRPGAVRPGRARADDRGPDGRDLPRAQGRGARHPPAQHPLGGPDEPRERRRPADQGGGRGDAPRRGPEGPGRRGPRRGTIRRTSWSARRALWRDGGARAGPGVAGLARPSRRRPPSGRPAPDDQLPR